MDRCAGCGGNAKTGKSFEEEVDGRNRMFCCPGCRQLYALKNAKEGRTDKHLLDTAKGYINNC
jgi:hypothetical protein